MKKILLLLCLVVMGYSHTVAQVITGQQAQISTNSLLSGHSTPAHNDQTPFSTQEAALPYSYYDSSLPTTNWILGGEYTPYIMLLIGQRITIPTLGGVVDSLHVTFGPNIVPDNFIVTLFPDTLLQFSATESFHLMNIFNQSAVPYGQVTVAKTDIVTGGPTTIIFNHISVPQHFFVAFVAQTNTDQTVFLPYEVLGDSKTTGSVTEDSRSGFIARDKETGQLISALLDGVFVPTGATEPIFSNLLVTAFVESGANGVQAYGYQSADALKAFPNPASDKMTFVTENATAAGSLELFDVSGRSVWNGTIDGVRQIDVNEMPSGIYHTIYRTGATSVTKTISITH